MKTIIVGLGNQGGKWVKAALEYEKIESVTLVDIDENKLNFFHDKYNISPNQLYTDLDIAIKEANADFLIDVTPPGLHETVTTKAFHAGLHVLGEKPISYEMGVAKRMVDQAEKSKRLYMVSQNYRFHPLARTTKRLIDEGKIGNPEYVNVSFFRGKHFSSDLYYNWIDYPLISDMSIHHFDLMRYLLNADPVSIYAISHNPSWSWFKGDTLLSSVLQFSKNIQVNYQANWCSTGRQCTLHGDWRIEGGNGGLFWDKDRLSYCFGDSENSYSEDVSLDKMLYKEQSFAIHEFISALLENRSPECEGKDNIKSLAMMMATFESVKRKEPVYIEEILNER